MSKPFVFILMPFKTSFDDIYKLGIKETCEQLGAYCERVDEQIFQGSILDRIFNQISKADVIIADMTGKSANVFFEVGYARGLDKKLILLTSESEDIPFDLKHYTHVVYNKSIVNLRTGLENHLKFYLSNLEKSPSEMSVGLNLYITGVQLLENEITKIQIPETERYIPLTIENISGKVVEKNSLQLAVSSDVDAVGKYLFPFSKDKRAVIDKNNKTKWSLNNENSIFHGAEQTIMLSTAPGDQGCSIQLKAH